VISVVVPLHNEEAAAPRLLDQLCSTLSVITKDFEIIFIDDGSTDKTLSSLLAVSEKYPQLKIVEFARRHGQTAALAAGIDVARGEVIITMDGDLQHDPREIPRFLSKLEEGFDIVSGWRKGRNDNFFFRRIPSGIANGIMRYVSGTSIKDFGSTYKAYRAQTVKKIELFGELHRFIPILAAKNGAKIVEIPITVAARVHGSSKYNLTRTFGVFEDIFFLQFFVNYLTKPIRAFGRLFFIFFGSGFAISSVLMVLWLLGSIHAVWEHSALLLFSVFLMTVGFQFLVVGLLAEILTRIYHHTSDTKIYNIKTIHTNT